MSVRQMSVFIENRIGGLAMITDALGNANVNIRALSIAETSDFGVLRLIVDDVDKAGRVMKEQGQVYSLTEVLAVAGEDKPGSIGRIISTLARGDIAIQYAYAFFAKSGETAYMIVRVDEEEMERARVLLCKNGIQVVSEEEIAKL